MRRDENYREMTKDKAGRTIYAFKVGDRVCRRSTGETGIIVNLNVYLCETVNPGHLERRSSGSCRISGLRVQQVVRCHHYRNSRREIEIQRS